jgi:hypothetical protein
VTLNFASADRARRAVRLARLLDAVASEVPPLHHARPLAPEAELAQRVEAASDALAVAPEPVVRRGAAFIADALALEQRLSAHGIALSELRVSPRVRHGARFVLRESALVAFALPVAVVDRVAHDLPVRLARAMARRSLAADPSRDQPAMRTILLAIALLSIWYLVIGIMLDHWLGAGVAVITLGVMFLSASAELALRDRVARAWRRARSYLVLRADPALRSAALADAARLLEEARTLEALLAESSRASRVSSEAQASGASTESPMR